MWWRWRWPLFAAGTVVALSLCIAGELQQAKIYNQRQPAEAHKSNGPRGNLPALTSSDKKTTEGNKESHWDDIFFEHPTDWLLVLFNGILAAFTVRLFYATAEQSRDLKASVAVAKTAADAALMQARAAVSSMRAHMIPVFPKRSPG